MNETVNDFLSSGDLFYDENGYNVPVEAFKSDLDYRPVVNKDLVGEPHPEDIYNEDPVVEISEDEEETNSEDEGEKINGGDENNNN